MQVNKSNKNYYLSNETVIVADGRRSSFKSYVTGGPGQAKLCCYDGWLRSHTCKEEKVTL
jgi:hypothetical protein